MDLVVLSLTSGESNKDVVKLSFFYFIKLAMMHEEGDEATHRLNHVSSHKRLGELVSYV